MFSPWVGKVPWKKGVATSSTIPAQRIPMDRGAWLTEACRVAELDTAEHTAQCGWSLRDLLATCFGTALIIVMLWDTLLFFL